MGPMEVQVEIVPTEDGRFRARSINPCQAEAYGNSRDEALETLAEQLGNRLHMRVASISHLLEYVDLEEGEPSNRSLDQSILSPRASMLSIMEKFMRFQADRYQPAVPWLLAVGVIGAAAGAWIFAFPAWAGFLIGFLTMAFLLAGVYALSTAPQN